MTTTIKFNGIEHIGRFKQSYVDGFVFTYMRANHWLKNWELDITVTGKRMLLFDTIWNYGLGCYVIGVGPSPLVDGSIKKRQQVEEYVSNCGRAHPGPNIIRRYLAEVCIEEHPMRGDRPFADLVTFDNLDFARGLYMANRMLNLPQNETFFDTTNLTTLNLVIDSESQAN